jgi:hypothetical protein
MNARVALNFGQTAFKYLDEILLKSDVNKNLSPAIKSEKLTLPYWHLCNPSCKVSVFKIKPEKTDDY